MCPDFPIGVYFARKKIPAAAFGRPNVNPPDIVIQDNAFLLSFTLNTDKALYGLPVPDDYAYGDINLHVDWTNDGGVDDNGLAAKWQADYQTAESGDPVNGSHANSPKTAEDTYNSASGWIMMHSLGMSIGGADFVGKEHLLIRLSAVTPVGAALTCEPHLICLCYHYWARNPYG